MARLIAAAGIMAAALLAGSPASARADRPPSRPPLSFSDLPGWRDDDVAAALSAFRRSCVAASARCRAAQQAALSGGEAPRRFFETWFRPVEIAADGFLTGYFEPEVPGSLVPDAVHTMPLRSRPPSLVMKGAGTPSGWPADPAGLVAARRTAKGYAPMPDRAAIEAGALDGEARPIVYLDPVDAFMIHVQGSARVRLADGRVLRVGYDGKNGYPYTAIGRVLAEREGIPPAQVTADRLWAWLKAHPAKAPAIMRANRSFIFFRWLQTDPSLGPIGGSGLPLTAGRSLAVDRKVWPYGTPVWLEADLPHPDGGTRRLRRLVVAQDTGTAIVGRARGDLFFGSGDQAGREASIVRHPVRWIVLRPVEPAKPRGGGR
ncbi:murein transglycosylase A [Enterovirga rhinocerotis]|uniref:peptidoglycan lytic exotransglycosylase n=1 Tax=Enterovirga rhinocerotis TaxID=1339210 RepID=A0A4R7BNS4_9HYPH|nr:MltA domain-containing protein [Enterovirga rhinocerotis]TDR87174.1 membrane-bound lytic murein transglycosylase A [Enterovirga rhinocerotis]